MSRSSCSRRICSVSRSPASCAPALTLAVGVQLRLPAQTLRALGDHRSRLVGRVDLAVLDLGHEREPSLTAGHRAVARAHDRDGPVLTHVCRDLVPRVGLDRSEPAAGALERGALLPALHRHGRELGHVDPAPVRGDEHDSDRQRGNLEGTEAAGDYSHQRCDDQGDPAHERHAREGRADAHDPAPSRVGEDRGGACERPRQSRMLCEQVLVGDPAKKLLGPRARDVLFAAVCRLAALSARSHAPRA